MSDAELRKQVVDQAWKELEDWRRHEKLTEFSKIFAAIDKSLQKLAPPKKAA